MTDLISARVAVDPVLGLPSGREAASGPVDPAGAKDAALQAKAVEFEATFLAEMLKHTGFGKMRETMNGGPGEEQFSGFLIREVALDIARTRPFGIGEAVAAHLAEQAK